LQQYMTQGRVAPTELSPLLDMNQVMTKTQESSPLRSLQQPS